MSDEKLKEILELVQEDDSNPSLPQAALTARGLFAGDILRSALHKRHRVEFGVDNVGAVKWPYLSASKMLQARGPSEKTEFRSEKIFSRIIKNS